MTHKNKTHVIKISNVNNWAAVCQAELVETLPNRNYFSTSVRRSERVLWTTGTLFLFNSLVQNICHKN